MSKPRLHDDKYLAFLRLQPCCCGCGRAAPSEAAHVRLGFLAMQKKPDDRFAIPLNAWCHRGPGQQHGGEAKFWEARGLDPFEIAERLYTEYGGAGGAPRQKCKTVKPRKPKHLRQKIQNRGFQRKESK